MSGDFVIEFLLGSHFMKQTVSFVAIAMLAASANAQFKQTPLTGTWSVTEIRITGPNARTITHPQPGLLIFTGNHYSLMIIESDQARELRSRVRKQRNRPLMNCWLRGGLSLPLLAPTKYRVIR